MTDKKVSTFSKSKGYNVCQSKLVADKCRQARSYQEKFKLTLNSTPLKDTMRGVFLF